MKHLSILYFTLLSLCVFAQKKEACAIKIYLEDAETGKNIDDAKVTLEGFEIPAINAKYDKKERVYYLKNKDYSKYRLIYIDHKNKEPQVFKKVKLFPAELTFKLFEKRTIIDTWTNYRKIWVNDTIHKEGNYVKEDSIIDVIYKTSWTLDHHKTLILLKNSSNLTYSEIKAKIDSLVEPYGLEYIDDLVPKMYFMKFFSLPCCSRPVGESSIICSVDENKSLKTFFKENPDRINFIKDNAFRDEYSTTDFFSENVEPYNNVYDWEKNCYVLPYRKKSKAPFRIENDPVINRINKNTTQLEFGKIRYNKFSFNEHYSRNKDEPIDEITDFIKKLTPEIVKQLDAKIMNYRFLRKYKNDYTRVLLMDYYINTPVFPLRLEKDGLYVPIDFSVPGHFSDKKYEWKHSFILDEELLYPEKQTTDFHNKTHCDLQRYIGYSFLFE
jgi:hypothetical protein